MAHQIIEATSLTSRHTIGVYPTFKAAKDAAFTQFQIAYFEQDADVAYDAADFLTEQGAVYSIDPVKGEA